MSLDVFLHFSNARKARRAERTVPVGLDRWANGSCNELRGELIRVDIWPAIAVVLMEMLDVFRLCLKFARVGIAMPYTRVGGFMVEPFLVGAVQTIGIRTLLVRAVIGLEVVNYVGSRLCISGHVGPC